MYFDFLEKLVVSLIRLRVVVYDGSESFSFMSEVLCLQLRHIACCPSAVLTALERAFQFCEAMLENEQERPLPEDARGFQANSPVPEPLAARLLAMMPSSTATFSD